MATEMDVNRQRAWLGESTHQRKVRKMREIALMDQTLKLMLKCVKKLSFDRMVGRTGAENHGWVPGHGALNAALMMDVILGQARELRHDR